MAPGSHLYHIPPGITIQTSLETLFKKLPHWANQAEASRLKPVGHWEARGLFWSRRRYRLQPHPACSFILLWPKEWLLCLRLSSRLSYERVRVSQEFLYILPGVALDKTPSTSKKKFCIGRLTSSILNPSSLMLIKLQKRLISINSFKKVIAKKDDKEDWWLFFLCTYLSIYLTFHHYICVLAGRTYYLGIYLRLSTCQGMQFVFFYYCNIWQECWAVG